MTTTPRNDGDWRLSSAPVVTGTNGNWPTCSASSGPKASESRADEFELAELASLRVDLEEAITTAVHGQRANRGSSWHDIGVALGVTKSAAYQRYGHAEEAAE